MLRVAVLGRFWGMLRFYNGASRLAIVSAKRQQTKALTPSKRLQPSHKNTYPGPWLPLRRESKVIGPQGLLSPKSLYISNIYIRSREDTQSTEGDPQKSCKFYIVSKLTPLFSVLYDQILSPSFRPSFALSSGAARPKRDRGFRAAKTANPRFFNRLQTPCANHYGGGIISVMTRQATLGEPTRRTRDFPSFHSSMVWA